MTTKPKTDQPTPTGVTMADTVALNGAPADQPTPTGVRSLEMDAQAEFTARLGNKEATPFISEGMRSDLDVYESVIDPVTGRKVTRADLGTPAGD